MIISGQNFCDATIARIRSQVRGDATLTRSALSREVCGWLGWQGHDGNPKEVTCRVALKRLADVGLIELPPAREAPFAKAVAAAPTDRNWPIIDSTLLELGRVWLEPVSGEQRDESRIWWDMMRAHHPQGGAGLCGAQLRYLVACKRAGQTEYLGGLAFSAPAWRLAERDKWIGWDNAERMAGLKMVVCNSRFLILPSVNVPSLASHVLGLAVKRIQGDWGARYGVAPVLLETFVDRTRFKGTCYRAANWVQIGQTAGRGRQDRRHAKAAGVKDILAYPLQSGWRTMLAAGAPSRKEAAAAAVPPPPPEPADWAEEEFGGCKLSKKLKARLLTIARDFFARPTANVPLACSDRAKAKAAYRFMDHKETTMETLLQAHYRATESRVSSERFVLAVQDTTTQNYTPHPATDGMGPIGTTAEGPQGLHTHSTLAFNTAGTPLGFLDVQCWARDPEDVGANKGKRHLMPIEEKESVKWLKSLRAVAEVQKRCPGTTLVSMGDREADIYELFLEAAADPKGPKLLVRAMQDRELLGEDERLWRTMQARPLEAMQALKVPRQGNRAARVAHLAVRYAQVGLQAPSGKKGPAIPVWAVLAQEKDAPAGVEPLEWMLLTTVAVETFEDALDRLAWYALRWGIEVMHRTLKSGCRIEQRQLASADRIKACLAIDLVVAWRIFYLTKLGRETPDVPCTACFSEDEWKALMVFTTKNPVPPEQPPTLRDAIRRTAGLGGFLGRKGDGEPGTQTMWLGLQRLDDIVEMWIVMRDATQMHVSSGRGSG